MASLFLYGKSKLLLLVSGRRYLQRGHNSSHFGLKQPLFFLVWHPPCFRLLIDIWRICPMHAWKLLTSCQHDQICKKLENGSRKQGFVRCGVFLQCSEIESDSFEIFQSQFGNPQISPFEFLWCTACWSKKQGAGMLTSNAKRIFCDNVTCFGTNKCCSNRGHLPECFMKAPHFLLAWLLCFFTRQHTRLSWL